MPPDSVKVDLMDLLETFRKRKVLILVITLVVVGLFLFFSFAQTPTYAAKATCMVSTTLTGNSQYAAVQVIEQLMQTFNTIAVSRPVLEQATKKLDKAVTNLDQLQEAVSSEVLTNTQIIRITARNGRPETAMLEANAVVDSLISYFAKQNGENSSYRIGKFEPAVTPKSPVSPKPVRNGIIGVVLGLLLGTVCAVAAEYMGDNSLIVSLSYGGGKKAVGLAQYWSTITGLSFKYPSDWEKKDQAFLQKLSKSNSETSKQGNEAVLIERGEGMFKHLLVVSSGQAPALSGDWQQDKDQLESGFNQGAGNQGYEITFCNIRLHAAPQANGFGMIYLTKQAFSPTYYQLHAYIVQGGSAYQFLLCTPVFSGDSEELEAREEFSRLLGSVSIRQLLTVN